MIRKTTAISMGLLSAVSSTEVNNLELNIFESQNLREKFIWSKEQEFDFDEALGDDQAVDWIGTSSIIGVFIWVFSLFFYGKTSYSDGTMTTNEPPVAWFWSNLNSTTLGWTAASYLSYFFAYMVVSLVEFIAWIMYKVGEPRFLGLWASWSLWGSLILYVFPWLFAMFQLWFPAQSGGIVSSGANGWTNAVTLMIIGFIVWVFEWFVHVLFVDRLRDHVTALEINKLKEMCSCKKFAPSAVSSPLERAANLLAQRKACAAKIAHPTCTDVMRRDIGQNCSLEMGATDTQAAYYDRCNQQATQACNINRNAGENDIVYLVRCKAASLVVDDGEEAVEGEAGDW